MRRNGYDSYHGRRRGRTVLLILITALLIILMLSLAALFFLEPYIHYSSDGVRIDLPPLFQKTEDDNPPDSTAPLQFTTPTPTRLPPPRLRRRHRPASGAWNCPCPI